MGALLAAIPLKDYVYGAIIIALLTAFGVYTHHERVVGADEALAPVAVIAHKAQVAVAVGTAVATATEKDNAKDYDQRAAHTAAPIGIVCYNPSSSAVPEADTVVAPGVGDLTADTGEGQHFDPSGAVLDNDGKAEAQIIYLQGRVAELKAQMENSP